MFFREFLAGGGWSGARKGPIAQIRNCDQTCAVPYSACRAYGKDAAAKPPGLVYLMMVTDPPVTHQRVPAPPPPLPPPPRA